jgi:hypothetical protein
VDLDAATARHATSTNSPRQQHTDQDRLLSPKEAAASYGVKERWLLDHADEIPGVRRLSRKVIRFSERMLRRHDTWRKARVCALDERVSFQDIVERALNQYLRKGGRA